MWDFANSFPLKEGYFDVDDGEAIREEVGAIYFSGTFAEIGEEF